MNFTILPSSSALIHSSFGIFVSLQAYPGDQCQNPMPLVRSIGWTS
jgi:hypothetical protein